MANIKKRLYPQPLGTGTQFRHDHLRPLGWGDGVDKYTSTVGKAIGIATNFYGKAIDNPVAERVTNGILMKGWRALLMARSIKRKAWDGINKAKSEPNNGSVYIANSLESSQKLRKVDIQEWSPKSRPDTFQPRVRFGHNIPWIMANGQQIDNVLDLLGKSKDLNTLIQPNQVIIYNLFGEKADKIVLQIRPNMIEMKPESSWADIKSMGRNLPMYHYLGASQELHINTSWFLSKKPGDPGFNPYEVINNCRKLESWTMANGYYSSPPILQIEWGRSGMFEDQFWILASATYNLKDFHDRALFLKDTAWSRDEQGNPRYSPNIRELINSGLVPYSATQELIFKRVSDHNLLHNEICPPLKPLETQSI